ncbi:hypothetical protein BDZ90DRAFT_142549 [Jaminaea rosea]|uniref:Uncharacterized protein n=1 Tax=Jaminaea rosea TaxID=1569628 RepID=A0A316UY66_9BASI|nr:hypothetical protein BDZ90DRAFT_142549 [Jaminaea rosea]PWN29251.1 hypothetical protein BDZ90DRAFT_142549 [Jaminaea rosea]
MAVPTNEDLAKALTSYDSLLAQRSSSSSGKRSPLLPSSTLVELEERVWEHIPAVLASRSQPHLNREELLICLAWKLGRGKYRPTLPSLVASNSEEKVVEVTGKAWRSFIPAREAREEDSLRNFPCLRILTSLRGIGPATASLLLGIFEVAARSDGSRCAQEEEGFMSDESWSCLPALQGRKVAYGEADWKRWRSAWGERLREWDRGARQLDRATWAYREGGGRGGGGGGVDEEGQEIARTKEKKTSTKLELEPPVDMGKKRGGDERGEQEEGRATKRTNTRTRTRGRR